MSLRDFYVWSQRKASLWGRPHPVIDSAIQGPNIEVVDANVEVVERRDRSGFALEDDIEVLTKV
ncbi:hypothetical protein SNOG_15953 [Parastagonospora nodorum SN15]|uniref:Uncharacterized protein n=1 Tax=Phaeosphaeria nodorum (strain SN15 / ATCC MYA-4574 / FGSC 10173) TaxID=321614 RepID=Q0TXD9_PHANO|nr:hypothetical protein SNOG_15953 [Parastagonospora nodorum SN15]EAT76791.1 hypothetical protein SNOG_15953 [Parastagonospora nodorum SN15]